MNTESIEPRFRILNVNGRVQFQIWGGISEEIEKELFNNKFDCLYLYAGSYPNLQFFLNMKSKIINLHLAGDIIDWESINQLTNVNTLYIDKYKKCPLEFDRLDNLMKLYTYWNDGYEETLKDLSNLKSLRVINYKHESISQLGKMDSLEVLSIIQSRSLKSLKGLSHLKSLAFFEGVKCSNLENISDIRNSLSLRSIILDGCKKLEDYSPIGGIESLKELMLYGSMNNLKWIEAILNLEKLTFECLLEDGDLSFIERMQNLKFVLFKNSKIYSHKLKDLQFMLEEKGFDQLQLKNERLNYDNYVDELIK